jgi:hypothetical protein
MEKGRHCAACQKTVVDFTDMSDAEIIRFLGSAGSKVCGRLLAGQMNRPLVPLSPVQRNGGKGWQLLLAGLMITADGTMYPQHPVVAGALSSHMAPPKADSTEDVLVGMIMPQIELDTAVEVIEVDTPGALMGDISTIVKDTVPGIEAPMQDTVASQKPDPVCKPADSLKIAYTGGITVQESTLVDTLKQIVKDTLTALHIIPRWELKVYPNPIIKGGIFHLAWQSEPGTYKVNLLSVTGSLIQTRVVEVGSSSQVDTWEMPNGLAAGVYIIQAAGAGQASVFTQKVVVE